MPAAALVCAAKEVNYQMRKLLLAAILATIVTLALATGVGADGIPFCCH